MANKPYDDTHMPWLWVSHPHAPYGDRVMGAILTILIMGGVGFCGWALYQMVVSQPIVMTAIVVALALIVGIPAFFHLKTEKDR